MNLPAVELLKTMTNGRNNELAVEEEKRGGGWRLWVGGSMAGVRRQMVI